MKTLSVTLGICLMLCGCSVKESSNLAQTYATEVAKVLDSGDYAKAKTMAIKALHEKPEVAEYSVAVAFAAVKLNEPSVAKEHFNKALDILGPEAKTDPERVDDCAMVLVCLGRKAKALATLNEGVERFPRSLALQKLHDDLDEWSKELSEYSIENAEQPAAQLQSKGAPSD